MSELPNKPETETQPIIGSLASLAADTRTQLAIRILQGKDTADSVMIDLAAALGKQIEFKAKELPQEGEAESVVAEVADRADAATDKLNRLKQNLATQYDNMDIRDKKPSFEQVVGSLGNNKLEIADTYGTPYLLMLPVTEEGSDKITGYKPVIAEGKQDMEPYEGDDLLETLKGRILARKGNGDKKGNRREGESGMTRVIYEHLFEAAKKAGVIIDKRFWTILDDDYNEGDPGVPVADSSVGQSGFGTGHAVFPGVGGRFRSAVVGDVLKI